MKKFAVVLSGCGVFDGAEIHEATLTLLAIKQNGADYEVFAPDIPQYHVINHITGEVMEESRNVLVESARIARGNIRNLTEYDPDRFDAIIFPGGFGVAKNLSDFAFNGAACSLHPEVDAAIKKTAKKRKPIGALCISPVIIVRALGDVEVTIGDDEATADAIVAMGGSHMEADHGEVIIDEEKLVFTTPCYMLDADIAQIFEGADNIVNAMIEYMP
ncbi:MAG: isoprenoid biosynthesis glyoxalase ElbB [Bacteroidales bacterium]|nr:isoprenoid biosynthesis glyoxalase ElbB [Bacteroidales bacterium]